MKAITGKQKKGIEGKYYGDRKTGPFLLFFHTPKHPYHHEKHIHKLGNQSGISGSLRLQSGQAQLSKNQNIIQTGIAQNRQKAGI